MFNALLLPTWEVFRGIYYVKYYGDWRGGGGGRWEKIKYEGAGEKIKKRDGKKWTKTE